MIPRAQLLWVAAMIPLGMAWLVMGSSDVLLLVAVVAGLGFLTSFPSITLRLLLLTVSCDQVLTLRVADTFTFRLAHACAAVLLGRLIVDNVRTRRALRLPFSALQPLVLYFAIAGLSVGQSAFMAKSVGYLGWAAFDVVAVWAVLLVHCRTSAGFVFVARWWFAGVLLAAVFGIMQLAVGFAGLPAPLAAQRLGEFPRINGFNYEPAYFALYLESAAAVGLGLWLHRPSRRMGALVMFLLLAAALSMSRSGWLGMGLLVLLGLMVLAISGASRLARSVAWLGVLVCVGTLMLPASFLRHAPRMAAMALDATEPSSTAPRLGMVGQAQKVFAEHPLLGVGLGGYGGYIKMHPELHVEGQEIDAARIVTTNLWLEVAAETGVVGVTALLWFLGRLWRSLWLGRSVARGQERALCDGFLISTVLVFVVLYQFNQTLWRLDVWVLLALAWSTVVRVDDWQRRKNAVTPVAQPVSMMPQPAAG